jgi:hypothetical protein
LTFGTITDHCVKRCLNTIVQQKRLMDRKSKLDNPNLTHKSEHLVYLLLTIWMVM